MRFFLTGALILPLVSGGGCGSSPSGGGSGGGSATGGAASGGHASGGSASGGTTQGSGGSAAGSGGATQGSGGTPAGSGGAPQGSGGAPAGSGGTPAGSGGMAPGSGGAASGGANGSGGAVGSGSGGSASGGSGTGSGGSANGGSGAGGRATGGGAGGGPSGGTGGAAGGSSGGCPADATFCSGFETTEFPTGAKYVTYQGSNNPSAWTSSFAVDTAVFRNGKSSLRVRSKKEANPPTEAYRMLSVPAPGAAFWVHFYLRSDIELGTAERVHNQFGGAAGSADPNEPTALEFAEDRSVAFNSHDDVRRPDGFSFDKPYLLPPNTWYCIELGFDSATRHQVMYVDGTKRIDATDYPAAASIKSPFAVYNFGLRDYHGFDGAMWIDDMIVSKTRVPCPTP